MGPHHKVALTCPACKQTRVVRYKPKKETLCQRCSIDKLKGSDYFIRRLARLRK